MSDDILKKKKRVNIIDGIQIYVSNSNTKYENRNDIVLIVLNSINTISGVFTKNKFCAAPVLISKKNLADSNKIRALIINSGNANAGTGKLGYDDALEVCKSVALHINCNINQVLPFSTGVILERLPVKSIIAALDKMKPVNWDIAAKAIMTTDTVPKCVSSQIIINGETISFSGIAKGSGMICPNMATLLSFIATDASIEKKLLDKIIKEVVEETFNCITVDGDTSTNDSFVIIATARSKRVCINNEYDNNYSIIKDEFKRLALELAKEIIKDAEGATKFIKIQINGAKSIQEAKKVAYSIAHSPLVKTAFFASDANLGRIICAIGNSDIDDLDANKIRLFLDNILVAENGGFTEFYREEDSAKIMNKSEITIRVELQRGDSCINVYTSDLSYEYVKINANYRS